MAGAAAVFVVYSLMSSALAEVPKYKLNNGVDMPAIALGTFLGFDERGVTKSQNKQLRDVVREAIDVGYRHFDTAAVYETEQEVGEAVRTKIAEGAVAREDVFVTTKLWNTHHGEDQVRKALEESLRKLGLDYVDLYLMHWPMGLNADYSYSDVDYVDTWRAMEAAQRAGLARALGVSNFSRQQLARLLQQASIRPAVIQIEIHPQIVQEELVEYAQSQGVVVMGHTPFGSLVTRFGQRFAGPSFDSPPLVEIARRHGKTTAQVVLRWLVDRNIVPVPKTVNYSRLKENIDIFDFALSAAERRAVSAFDSGARYTRPAFWQPHPHYPFERTAPPAADPFASG